MQCSGDGIVSRSVLSLGELMGVKSWWNHATNYVLRKPVKALFHQYAFLILSKRCLFEVSRDDESSHWMYCKFATLTAYSSLSVRSVSACDGMYAAVATTAMNSLGNLNGWHRRVRYSPISAPPPPSLLKVSGPIPCFYIQKLATLIVKYMPPPLTYPDNTFDLLARNTENTVGMMPWSDVSSDSQVSVRQIKLQSLISLCKEILAHSSHNLWSKDWILTSSMLGGGGRLEHRFSLTSTPALLPLRQWQRLFNGNNVQDESWVSRGSQCRSSATTLAVNESFMPDNRLCLV